MNFLCHLQKILWACCRVLQEREVGSTQATASKALAMDNGLSSLLTMPKPLTVWTTINRGKFWKRWEYQITWPASWETCMDHSKLWKILKEIGIPDHLTCLLRNLYADQEATVRTGHGTTDWLQLGKGIQGCILSPCLFSLYAEYIMRNTGLDEAQARIKIASRNINNLR